MTTILQATLEEVVSLPSGVRAYLHSSATSIDGVSLQPNYYRDTNCSRPLQWRYHVGDIEGCNHEGYGFHVRVYRRGVNTTGYVEVPARSIAFFYDSLRDTVYNLTTHQAYIRNCLSGLDDPTTAVEPASMTRPPPTDRYGNGIPCLENIDKTCVPCHRYVVCFGV